MARPPRPNTRPTGKPEIIDAEWEEIGESPPGEEPENLRSFLWSGVFAAARNLIIAIGVIVVALVVIGVWAGDSGTNDLAHAEDRSASRFGPEQTAPEQTGALPTLSREAQRDLRRGQSYSDVRQSLLEQGYIPARYLNRSCAPYGTWPGQECHNRPEISYCSGTGAGYCSAYWLKGDAVLFALVAEGPNGTLEDVSPMTRSELDAVLAQDGTSLLN